ncbi:hypothetical protein MFLAVUS_011271 [Mucor flavus]|uniref:Uncharacterized protein n=1 Tax=Mucor flavus TaxID=439312 RepID=A0ABP9ZF22_9FUNG
MQILQVKGIRNFIRKDISNIYYLMKKDVDGGEMFRFYEQLARQKLCCKLQS